MTGMASTKTASADLLIQSGQRALESEKAGLEALIVAMSSEMGASFAAAAQIIARSSGRVIVSGMGKSGHIGRKIAATLASTGTPAYFVHPAEASHGDLGMVQPEDVILALSWSGETTELSDIVAYAKRFRVTLIGVSSNKDSALGREADILITLPKAKEACPNGIAPTTSTTMQVALGDALAIALLEARGFSSHDFRTYHPGGKLGAQLKQLSAIMSTGELLPLVPKGTRMGEALVTMSAKGFGCVLVVDAQGLLIGIITDGDLRRHMSVDLLGQTVDQVMTANPASVPPETLVAEALEIVETRKIGALIVTQDRVPVGLVHVLDLLRIGAA
jgi:arabinose-5-phosphate isomerase